MTGICALLPATLVAQVGQAYRPGAVSVVERVADAAALAAVACSSATNADEQRLQQDTGALYQCYDDGGGYGWQLVADPAGGGGGGGPSISLDLENDAVVESAALTEIATAAASPVFSEPAPDKLLIDPGQPWASALALAADPAACPASQFGTDTDTAGALTCSQVNFTDLAGAATDAQVPDTITIDLAATATALASDPSACPAGQYGTDTTAQAVLVCSQVDFSELSGAATDAQVPDSITVDLATAASALAADGGNCAAGLGAGGTDAAGAAQDCTDYEEDLADSAGLAAALADETGTGAAVFAGSPALTGDPTVPTATGGDADTSAASTAFVAGEITTHAGNANVHHPQAHALGGGDHTLSGGVDGQTLQATGASTFEFDYTRIRFHATDCTALTDGEADEPCYERDDDKIYVCEPTAGLCDTPAEWRPTGGGAPGGSTTQVQFNDAGAFAGDADLTWDKTTNSLGMPGGTSLRHDGSNLLLTTTTGMARLTTGGVTTLRLNGSNPRVEDIGSFGFDIQAGTGVFLRFTVGGWGPRHNDTDTVYGHCDSGDCLALRTGGTNRVEVRNASVQIMGCKFHGKLASPPSGVECDSYWDTDLKMLCHYNGTNWLQADDWSTFCT